MSHDLIERYVEMASQCTDAPTRFHEACAYGFLASALGRGIHLRHGNNVIYPHLWISLIAPSSIGRKSTCISIAENLVAEIDESLLLPARFTLEKMYEVLQERATGLLTYGEMQQFLGMMDRDYNSELRSNLSDWWDSPPARTYAAKNIGRVTIRRPCLTILTGSTLEWFLAVAKNRDSAGGLYPRFLFVVVPRSDRKRLVLPPPRDQAKASSIKLLVKNEIRDVFKDAAEPFQDARGSAVLDESGLAEYSAAFHSIEQKFGAREATWPYAARGQIYLIKCAMIAAIAADRSIIISKRHVERALAFVERSLMDTTGSILDHLDDGYDARQLRRIAGVITESGIEGILHRDLVRRIKLKARLVEEYADTLEAGGEVKRLLGKRKDQIRWISCASLDADPPEQGRLFEPSNGQ